MIGVPERQLRRGRDGLDQAARGRGSQRAGARRGLQGKIASYKIPRYWKFVDSFPMTFTGKVQKYRMREIAIEELAL